MTEHESIPAPELPNVRRVVTGHDESGRSAVISDDAIVAQGHAAIGLGVAALWSAGAAPSNQGPAQPAAAAIPGPGGTSFMVVCYPPESHIQGLPPELHELATLSPADQVPGLLKADTSRHHAMHYSETVDYGVVLGGEVTLVLDTGDIILRAGDTYVLRGGAHAWSNRGSESAIVAVVVVGAQPYAGRHG